MAFLSSAASVAVGDRAERSTGEAAVTVPPSAIRNIAGLLREQDTQSDRMERRLRSLHGVDARLTGLDNNVQDHFGLGPRYRGRNLAGLIMCIYDADLRSDKACEGGP